MLPGQACSDAINPASRKGIRLGGGLGAEGREAPRVGVGGTEQEPRDTRHDLAIVMPASALLLTCSVTR